MRFAEGIQYREQRVSTHGMMFRLFSTFCSRVDVTISAGGVPKVMRPVVTMETRTSDGSIHTFEVPPEQLHQLRYSVAKVLNEMGSVEAHPVLKIA
jgi:COMM domain